MQEPLTTFMYYYIFQASLAYILFISFYVFDYRIQMGLNILWHFLPMGTISSHVQLGPSTTIKMALMRTQKLTICETITLFLIAQCCCFGFCRKKMRTVYVNYMGNKVVYVFCGKGWNTQCGKNINSLTKNDFIKLVFAYKKCRSKIQYFPHCG